MKKPAIDSIDKVKEKMISEGWKYLGTADMEVWAKDKERILYCPISKTIKSKYTSKK